MKKRSTDNAFYTQQREKLFIQLAGQYFFKSREGHMFGPYKNLEQAKTARQLFVYSMTGNESDKPDVSPRYHKSLFLVEEVEFEEPNKVRSGK